MQPRNRLINLTTIIPRGNDNGLGKYAEGETDVKPRHIIIVGGGTAGSVLAARLSASGADRVTLLEAGPDESAYGDYVLDPSLAPDAWKGAGPIARTTMISEYGDISIFQARMMGGMSAANGLATLRGLPLDYDGWEASGLAGWGWGDVVQTFKSLETDCDFGASGLHGGDGPLTVRRWRRDEMSTAQLAFLDGMQEAGNAKVDDINDPAQLPGIGVFPVTLDMAGGPKADQCAKRLTTSLAFLTPQVRLRENLTIRTNAEVARIVFEANRACGVRLTSGEELLGDEIIISTGALWSPNLLMRSGIGPADHLAEHSIELKVDLPVGQSLSDHLGPGIIYRHDGPRGGSAGPAQSLYIGASEGVTPDYHLFPIARTPGDAGEQGPTMFMMAAFVMRSSGNGCVKLGENEADGPQVMAPQLPADGLDILRHAFAKLAEWEQTEAFKQSGCQQLVPTDLSSEDGVKAVLDRAYLSYGHMTSSCPMGPVLDADCRVHAVKGLRVVDASCMPTIPAGNTYLGTAMIAERIAQKMSLESLA